MRADFLKGEFTDLGVRLAHCAQNLGRGRLTEYDWLEEAAEFGRQPVPETYAELLARVRQAVAITEQWKREQRFLENNINAEDATEILQTTFEMTP